MFETKKLLKIALENAEHYKNLYNIKQDEVWKLEKEVFKLRKLETEVIEFSKRYAPPLPTTWKEVLDRS